MLKESVLGLLRHFLTTLGGAAAATGYATDSEVAAITGGVIALVGVVWSVWDKRKRKI